MGLVLPCSNASTIDLWQGSSLLGRIVEAFVESNRPICAIGFGVAGLFGAKSNNNNWIYDDYCVTGISNYEISKYPYFFKMKVIIEDWIKDHGSHYSCNPGRGNHVIVDRDLITAQNEISTELAIQNFIYILSKK